MNKFKVLPILVLLFLPAFAFANSYSSIHYTISPVVEAKISTARVEMEIKGQLSSKLIIDLPYHWANAEYSEQIKNITVNGSDQGFKITKKPGHQLNITLPKPTNAIKISYEIQQKTENPSDVHEAIIRRDLIHAPGYGLFATPADMKGADELLVDIQWQKLPPTWNTISSYGEGKSLHFKTEVRRLSHAIYGAGDLRIYQIADQKSPVFLSLYGAFDTKDNVIVSALKEIIKTQRSFFNDHDFPYYAISIIEGDKPGSMGGTRLHDGFTAYVPKGTDKKDWYIMFAHEHLHNWIGGKIRKNEQEELNYWWSEGFTDYYSIVLALRAGTISLEEFIQECNEFLRKYYLSPVLNEPNARIKKDFWKNHDVEKLPYYRGFVFAIYLNDLTKFYNNSNSIDNIILDLFAMSKQHKFSAELFKKIAKKYIKQGIDEQISDFIIKGKTIDLTGLTQSLPIKKIKMGAYDLGFDREAVLKEKIIKNIDTNSNAYISGLREGDQVTSWSIPGERDLDQIVTIKTRDKTFEFRPENPLKKEVYQFKANLSRQEKLKIKRFFGAGN